MIVYRPTVNNRLGSQTHPVTGRPVGWSGGSVRIPDLQRRSRTTFSVAAAELLDWK